MSWLGSVGRSGTIYPSSGLFGFTGLSGFPSLSFGVNPGTYGNVSVGCPGFVGSSGLYVTTSVVFSESAVTFTTTTLALSAKYPLTTGDLTSAKSCAGVQSPYVTSPVTKLTLASRVNLASCVTVFGVPSSFNTGVPSAYTYVIVRVTVLFRSFSSKPAGYLGPSGLFGSTGVPGVFGWSGVTGTTRSLNVTLNSWSVVVSLSNLPFSG